jgi:hypothetical protein
MDRRLSGVLPRALAGQVTEAHRAKRARRGTPSRTVWPSPFTLELMDELLGMEMMTHDPASTKERQH